MPSTAQPRIALVLSGGGARGAYEAGVLSFLFDDLPARLGRPVHFDIITGTSVGAVHACYAAATQGEVGAGQRLLSLWRSLSLGKVFDVGLRDLFRVPWQILGLGAPRLPLLARDDGVPERLPGLFDTAWLEDIVLNNVDWKGLRRRIDGGEMSALALASTEIATGRSVLFVDQHGDGELEWKHDPFVIARAARIGPPHALASAAIPLVFPAVRIGPTYYCDGGLRLNTPLAPALRLGADRVLVLSLRYPRPAEEEDRLARRREAGYASPTFLAGKALNALLLDRVEYDVDRLRLFNAILRRGVAHYGDDFLSVVNAPIEEMQGKRYRIVPDLLLHPSQDLGRVADACLRHQPRSQGIRDWLSRNVVRYAGKDALGEADLLSYLFFDRCFADHLIELGRKDALAAADDLVAFLA